ncbi:hypothetical protein B7P43_G17306 [Cryptotermes secundus]|uniref:Uncharacterized protein n=1 Tax=Cryptotermes secundus TaxID=105785 RepID=A0A2J7QIF0_9NEOP|nr:hypothetical protein B7P43_G17306 [Cryptotermes secundus]
MNDNVSRTVACNYLNGSDFPLPLFDEGTETNPVYHLRQLDEFMSLKNIPKTQQLAIACKSISGSLSRQWIATTRHALTDYASFRCAFLKTWWTGAEQGLVRCRLYQSKYNKQSGLSLSAHFLKYATSATYLEPRPTDSHIIEALRFHFPISVQKVMLSAPVHTISEALNLLKRVEVMESYEPQRSGENHNYNRQEPDKRNPPSRGNYNSHQGPQNVRNVHTSPQRRNNRYNNYHRRDNSYHEGRNQHADSNNRNNMNPRAPPFESNTGPARETQTIANPTVTSVN